MLLKKAFRSLGPAIIIASLVLGPGSILTSSKVGIEYGYQMLWVVAMASLLMIGMTTLGAFLGVSCAHSPCEEVALRAGRPWAAALGIIVFLIIACFQSGNNVAVLASIETFFPASAELTASDGQGDQQTEADATGLSQKSISTILLVGLNLLIIIMLYGLKSLYRPLEMLMMGLVLMMLVGFSVNLWFAKPSLSEAIQGFIPTLPTGPEAGFLPKRTEGGIVDPLWALQGMIATTLSVAGAFYQCYLVKEKGWTLANVRQSFTDSAFGISLLGLVSAIIMLTSAAALHGKAAPSEFNSAVDVAKQLEPLFGSSARQLFSLGIFAAAFSSFLGNALAGGTILSDGLGLGYSMNSPWPKRLTILALLLGMSVAIAGTSAGLSTFYLIVFAQALTVLGVPMLAGVMLWLAHRQKAVNQSPVPNWILTLAWIAALLTTALAIRTAWRLYLQFN